MNNLFKGLLVILFIVFHSALFSQNLSLQKVEHELQNTYQEILKLYKADAQFVDNLIVSQTSWISYRDAEMELKYPKKEKGYYGSIFEECRVDYKVQLTKDRLKKLKSWIVGIEEGEVCRGSVRLKPE